MAEPFKPVSGRGSTTVMHKYITVYCGYCVMLGIASLCFSLFADHTPQVLFLVEIGHVGS